MKTTTILAFIFSASALACGGGGDGGGSRSGVNQSAQVGDLSESDMRQLCEWGVQAQGGAGSTEQCDNGFEATVGTVDECIANQQSYASCDLTVGQVEDCTAAGPCAVLGDPACAPVVECLSQGS